VTKGLISIIIPVYQVSDYVERCIRSVMSQTFKDIECIIVDDATEDDSIDKCERLIKEYNDNLNDNLDVRGGVRFKILHHEMNRGLSAARNTGTKAATGEFVFYLDGDDEITHDCIEKMMLMAVKYPEAEMVVGNYMECREGVRAKVMHGEDLPAVIQSNEEYARYYRLHRISHSAWNKLIKRSFIEKHGLYFKEGILYEDYMWMFHVAKYVSFVCVVKDVTYHYCIRSGSITMDSDEKKVGESYVVIYDNILNHLTPRRERKELTYCVERFCKQYLTYKDTMPAYKELLGLFTEQAKEYRCWYAYMVLMVVAMMGQIGNPMKLLSALHVVRWKLTPFLYKVNGSVK